MNKILEISNDKLTFNNKKILTEGDIIRLPLGTLIQSTVVQDETSGLILADGSTYSQTGILSEFASWLKSKFPNGDYTNEEYERDLTNFGGQCGHYVIDDTNGTIRFPRIIEFVASNNAGQKIGTAELDSFKSHSHDISYHFAEYKAGTSRYPWMYTADSTYPNYGGSTQLKGDNETKPKNIRYPYYIVVANGVETNVKIDINNYLSNLTELSSQLEMISNDLNPTVLWENANPTGDFNEQTIELASSDYDYLVWICKTTASSDSTSYSCVTLKGLAPLLSNFNISITYNPDYLIMAQYRLVTRNSDVSFQISKNYFGCVKANGAEYRSSDSSPRNDLNFPIKILGFKGVVKQWII